MNTKVYYSHGKLLLTGEYLVLDGAKAIALPTRLGQYLSVQESNSPINTWNSYDHNRELWYTFNFDSLQDHNPVKDQKITNTLLQLLKTAQELNPNFLNTGSFCANTLLTFNRNFGLGSSSTLITNIAQWAKVNPYQLLWKAFGGSGYDIACALSNTPIYFQLNKHQPIVTALNFNPTFSEQLYFVYLNQKKDSKEAIAHYKTLDLQTKEEAVHSINTITKHIATCRELNDFNVLINQHERIVSRVIQTPTIKEQLFSDYKKGSIKSLGGWGGDFILVSTQDPTDLNYFRQKGFKTIYSYQDLIL